MARRNRDVGLDPETDYTEIYRNLVTYDFPWDFTQALSFALFRTYAVPSIGRLLDETGEFTKRTQKRYDDTGLLLEVPTLQGPDSPEGRAAIRRINQMHRSYDIAADDLRYVLSTFVVVPTRWIEDHGWRRLTGPELLATVRYYQRLGELMGIREIPATYDTFATLMDDYERAHFAFDPGARRVADATLGLLTTFYPRPVRPLVELFSRSIMDAPLREAFGYADPGAPARLLAAAALRARARFVALLPPRHRPVHLQDLGRIRSYPDGYTVAALGTHPPGCPVAPRSDHA